ncbi:MAG: DUF5348 domain-containing protein [Bacillota bacterium]
MQGVFGNVYSLDYLEQRYLDNGKLKCRSKYLGQNPLKTLLEMLSAGEIDKYTYEKMVKWEPEGILKPTIDGGLNINGFGFLKGSRIGLFFENRWLYGRVDKDEHGWHLVDEGDNLVSLRPGIRARLWF